MKQYYFSLLLILLLLLSCQQETDKTEKKEALPVSSRHTGTSEKEVGQKENQDGQQVDEALVRECTEYWAEIQRLNSIAADYFSQEFLPKALANPALPGENRKFLLALKADLHQPKEEFHSNLAIEQVLLPIFKLNKDQLGILAFPKYDIDNPDLQDISLEHKILTQHKLAPAYDNHSQTKLALHPTLADSLFKNRNRSVYTYTTQRKVKTQITNFASYHGECLLYYNYLLDNKPFKGDDKVLFGSRYSLDLNYKGEPEIDALLKSQYKKKCQDCPNSGELQKTFASLQGVEGLYFLYADTFPLNNELDTPLRGLVMKMNDKLVYLWHAEVDLVGCSCI
ncbi:hypothetical protein OB13_17655 [Pontibacter sp. HJ8]